MSIFKEIHEKFGFDSDHEFKEFRRMLSEAISRGFVEQVAVMKPSRFNPLEKWYREKETGEIYSLLEPDGDRGWWAKVDPERVIEPGETVQ
jgi:hypothetical protein